MVGTSLPLVRSSAAFSQCCFCTRIRSGRRRAHRRSLGRGSSRDCSDRRARARLCSAQALGADRIETRSPGYLLQLSGDEFDLTRFEMGVAQARGEGDRPDAAITWQTALALWRGEALADFRYEPFAQAEAARLEELRLSGSRSASTPISRSAATEVVPDLERLIAEHPFASVCAGS